LTIEYGTNRPHPLDPRHGLPPPPEPKKNILEKRQQWFVKFPGTSWLEQVELCDVTEHTVQVWIKDDTRSSLFNFARFKITDIEFVERVK
jgi:hypothetical protein